MDTDAAITLPRRSRRDTLEEKKERSVTQSVDVLTGICDKYFKERREHTLDRWLTFRALKERCLYDPKRELKVFRNIMIDGFMRDHSFRSWLQKEIENGVINRDDLINYVVLLKNHKSRVSWRSEFITISVGITALLTTAVSLFNLPQIIPVIIAIFTFFALSERTMLNDTKSATDELLAILESEASAK